MFLNDSAVWHHYTTVPIRGAPGFWAPMGAVACSAAAAHGVFGSGAARSKLRGALAWLRARDPWIAERIERVECRLGPGVGAVSPRADRTLLVNPAALTDLSPEEIAGLLVSAVLAVPELARLEAAERTELAARVDSSWSGENRDH